MGCSGLFLLGCWLLLVVEGIFFRKENGYNNILYRGISKTQSRNSCPFNNSKPRSDEHVSIEGDACCTARNSSIRDRSQYKELLGFTQIILHEFRIGLSGLPHEDMETLICFVLPLMAQ